VDVSDDVYDFQFASWRLALGLMEERKKERKEDVM
jgi:hypothetical protein